MKKCYGLLVLALTLLVAPVAMADDPSVGVYFDTAGTQSTAILNGGFDEQHTAYVIGYSEMLVGGAAFELDIFPRITILNTIYPPGIQIGTLTEGIEIGLQNPVVGYFHVPVLLATLTLWTGEQLMTYARINTIADFPRYESVVLADLNGNLIPAVGRCAWLTVPVGVDHNSWSQVKSLYAQ